jgi:hypothetical protein
LRAHDIGLSGHKGRGWWVLGVVVGLLLGVFGWVGVAGAVVLPVSDLGFEVEVHQVGGGLVPSDLATGSGSGAQLARVVVIEGKDEDSLVGFLAAAHVRLYAEMGLPCPPGVTGSACTDETEWSPAAAASEMSSFVAAFARRYGPGGTFWAAHPDLPYLPVESFEIGDEPNIPVYWVADALHLHWADPSNPNLVDAADYAEVYEAARSALHAVDPTGVAVVGGLADSASGGVDVQSDEQLLAGLTPGSVDAVGYHPWVYDVSDSLLNTDTTELRDWMDAHGMGGVPIDVNELGACQTTAETTDDYECAVSQTSAAWGSVLTSYMRWALCTPSLDVDKVLAFYWGGEPGTDQQVWLPLASSDLELTPYGEDYLAEASLLTTVGCSGGSASGDSPPVNSSLPVVRGSAVSGDTLRATAGGWSGAPAPVLVYQWLRCDGSGENCVVVGSGSTAFELGAGEVGYTVRFLVTASNTAGIRTAISAPTGLVGAGVTSTSTSSSSSSSTSSSSTTSSTPTSTTTTTTSSTPTTTSTTTSHPTSTTTSTTTSHPTSTTTSTTTTHPTRTTTSTGTSTTTTTTTSPTTSVPVWTSVPSVGGRGLRSMGLRVSRLVRRGRDVSIRVRRAAGSGGVRVVAYGRGRRHLRRRLVARRPKGGVTMFEAVLSPGRWRVVVTGQPAAGFAAPRAYARDVTVPTRKQLQAERARVAAAFAAVWAEGIPLAAGRVGSAYVNVSCMWAPDLDHAAARRCVR